MNYSDFDNIEIDENVGARFGKESQLEVIGWSGKQGTSRVYVLRCHKCAEDADLHGDGLYKSIKGSLVSGQVPCGCALSTRWTEHQYEILCKRKAKEMDYEFLGWSETFHGRATKISLKCQAHGIWNTGIINNFTRRGVGCPGCKAKLVGIRSSKSDEELINSFFSTGAFHPETIFVRSETLNDRGHKVFWFMSCPDCSETVETLGNSLGRGHRPCACCKQRQTQGYINIIKDVDNTIAIKFGISRDSSSRQTQQQRNSTLNLIGYKVYVFPDVNTCKLAERECLKTLDCGVVDKELLPDGYTETTWLYNISKVCSIYENFGGVVMEKLV